MFCDILRSLQILQIAEYGVMPRYPFEIEILDSDAETAIQKAAEILSLITINLSGGGAE